MKYLLEVWDTGLNRWDIPCNRVEDALYPTLSEGKRAIKRMMRDRKALVGIFRYEPVRTPQELVNELRTLRYDYTAERFFAVFYPLGAPLDTGRAT